MDFPLHSLLFKSPILPFSFFLFIVGHIAQHATGVHIADVALVVKVCDCQPQESEITLLGSTHTVCIAVSSTKLPEQKIANPPNGFVF